MTALNIIDRILAKVMPSADGCWNFLGAHDRYGYGKIVCRKVGGRHSTEKVHRVMFMAFNGGIPEGLVVRHRCDNRSCCNPAHLLAGTQKENIWDQMAKGSHISQNRVINPPF